MLLKKLFFILNVLLILSSRPVFAAETKPSDQQFYRQFQDVFERISKDYVQEPDKQEMTDAAISGMLASLDPHSIYFTGEDLEDFINHTKGEFGGIGVEVMNDNGVVKVISPIDDLPADKAGIQAGDYIVGVNEDLVVNLGFNKAVKAMRGDAGTKVKLLILKEDDSKPREVELTRDIVKIKPVKSHMEEGNIAYVRIVTFNEHTISELKKSFKTLLETPGGIKGIILDLRNNPGGMLEQAISVSEFFMDSGVIVSTKGRTASNNSVSSASKFSAKAPKAPIVVLINSGSASGSEIVAGALQDHKIAIVVGTKSFGKGSVQTFVQISPRSAVKLTTAKYYTPNGRSIQAEGIDPDIVIETAKVEYAEKIPDNKRFSEASLKNYLKNENDKEKGMSKINSKDTAKATIDKKATSEVKDKKGKKDKTAAKRLEKQPSELYKKDYQFARAYDLISGLIISSKLR